MYMLEDVVFISAKQFTMMYEAISKFSKDSMFLSSYKESYKSVKTLELLPTVSVGERPSVAVHHQDIQEFKDVCESTDKQEIDRFLRTRF